MLYRQRLDLELDLFTFFTLPSCCDALPSFIPSISRLTKPTPLPTAMPCVCVCVCVISFFVCELLAFVSSFPTTSVLFSVPPLRLVQVQRAWLTVNATFLKNDFHPSRLCLQCPNIVQRPSVINSAETDETSTTHQGTTQHTHTHTTTPTIHPVGTQRCRSSHPPTQPTHTHISRNPKVTRTYRPGHGGDSE